MRKFAQGYLGRLRRSRFLQGVLVGVLGCALLSASAALAVPSTTGVVAIHACVNKHTFVLTERHGPSCPSGTRPLSWNSAPAQPATRPLSDGTALAYADGKLWVDNGKKLEVISDATGKVLKTMAEPAQATIDVGGGAVWVLLPAANKILELNESTGSVTRTLGTGLNLDFPLDLAISGTTAWVSNFGDPSNSSDAGSVTEFNASTGSFIANFPSDGLFAHPIGIATDAQDVFVENQGRPSSGITVVYTNPGFKFVNQFGVGLLGLPTFQGGNVWATWSVINGTIAEYNSTLSAQLLSKFFWPNPTGPLTWDGSHWWTFDTSLNSVIEMDSTGHTLKAYDTASGIFAPEALAFDGHHIWVLNGTGNLVELPLT